MKPIRPELVILSTKWYHVWRWLQRLAPDEILEFTLSPLKWVWPVLCSQAVSSIMLASRYTKKQTSMLDRPCGEVPQEIKQPREGITLRQAAEEPRDLFLWTPQSRWPILMRAAGTGKKPVTVSPTTPHGTDSLLHCAWSECPTHETV